MFLLISCATCGAAGCTRQQSAKPAQQQPAGKAAIVITSPQPGSLADSPLIVRGTAGTAAGNVMLRLLTEDGHRVIPMDLSVPVAGGSPQGTFEAVLNFIPPATADGYVVAFHRSTEDGPELDRVSEPVKYLRRSNDPGTYPTAYVAKNTSLLDQPGGKAIRNDITRGRAVTVLKQDVYQQKNWSLIMIYVYDTPMNYVGWVPSADLTAQAAGLDLIEGLLKADTTLWSGPPPAGKPTGDRAHGGSPFLIQEKRNGWGRGYFPGDNEGWIPISDLNFTGPPITYYTAG
jgi:hypothetical protein